jgi:DNA polymerase-3 subunit delta'
MPFREIVGHSKSIAILQRIVTSGRIAHAFLFIGPEGTGRKMCAQAFIAALFCGKEDACGDCPSCRKLAAGSHPDLHTLEPDGQFIKIDQIRSLQRELAYRPYEAPRKACIIDGADRLNQSSGNALLKTLEEPPGNALLILLATTVDNVLPTIRSRCQQLLFSGIATEEIETFLRNRGTDAETAQVAASLADGSITRGLALCSEEIMANRTAIITAACNLHRQEMLPLFTLGEMFDKDREKSTQAIELLTSFWRDMLLLRCGSGQVVNRDMLPLLQQESAKRSERTLMDNIEQLDRTRGAILRNANVRLALDVLSMRLAV